MRKLLLVGGFADGDFYELPDGPILPDAVMIRSAVDSLHAKEERYELAWIEIDGEEFNFYYWHRMSDVAVRARLAEHIANAK